MQKKATLLLIAVSAILGFGAGIVLIIDNDAQHLKLTVFVLASFALLGGARWLVKQIKTKGK